MDPAGIVMLRSVRKVFELIGLEPESINFVKEEYCYRDLIEELTEQPKKCPAIVTLNILGNRSPHIMVATNALQGREFIPSHDLNAERLRDQWFINCKNSYRDDITEPGTRLKVFSRYKQTDSFSQLTCKKI